MKKHALLFALIISFWLPVALADNNPEVGADIGDGLTDAEKRKLFGETKILFESLKEVIHDLKKVNVRLKDLETSDVKNLKQTHAEIINQVEMIQKLIPDLRGIVEQSQIDLTRRIGGLSSNMTQAISNIESRMQKHFRRVDSLLAVQRETRELLPAIVGVQEKNFKDIDQQIDGLNINIGQLQEDAKKDMKAFADLNKQAFKGFSKVNADAFQRVVANLNEQNQKVAQANNDLVGMFRTELFPALQNTMIQNFAGIKSENNKVIEIQKKNLQEQQVLNQRIALLEENLAKANSNVMMVEGKMTHITEILEGLKNQGNSVGNSLNTLHASVARLHEIASHSEKSISNNN